MSARWQRWMRKMSMVAEYMERPNACVGTVGRLGSAFCIVSTNMCLVKHTLCRGEVE